MQRFQEHQLEDVLPSLREGQAIRRQSWPLKMQVFITEDLEHPSGSGRWVLGFRNHDGVPGYRGGQFEYQFTVDDLLASDWAVLRKLKIEGVDEEE